MDRAAWPPLCTGPEFLALLAEAGLTDPVVAADTGFNLVLAATKGTVTGVRTDS